MTDKHKKTPEVELLRKCFPLILQSKKKKKKESHVVHAAAVDMK